LIPAVPPPWQTGSACSRGPCPRYGDRGSLSAFCPRGCRPTAPAATPRSRGDFHVVAPALCGTGTGGSDPDDRLLPPPVLSKFVLPARALLRPALLRPVRRCLSGAGGGLRGAGGRLRRRRMPLTPHPRPGALRRQAVRPQLHRRLGPPVRLAARLPERRRKRSEWGLSFLPCTQRHARLDSADRIWIQLLPLRRCAYFARAVWSGAQHQGTGDGSGEAREFPPCALIGHDALVDSGATRCRTMWAFPTAKSVPPAQVGRRQSLFPWAEKEILPCSFGPFTSACFWLLPCSPADVTIAVVAPAAARARAATSPAARRASSLG
jgi:hypothetical protein